MAEKINFLNEMNKLCEIFFFCDLYDLCNRNTFDEICQIVVGW